jgi:hypothetical protein
MKVEDFRVFVNSNILPNLVPGIETKGLSKVSLEKGITNTTARKWLHYLGCYYKEGRKDVYYDGHEREDVVKYRNEFVPRLLSWFNDPNILLVFQDEVIYKSYECQTAYWHLPENIETGEATNVHLKKKGGGYGLMLSGFTTNRGFIVLTPAEVVAVNAARAEKGLGPLSTLTRVRDDEVDGELGAPVLYFGYQLFEYGKHREGYWDSDKMLIQTDEIISVLEYKFPGKIIVFLFDWSSGHGKKPVDAIVLSKMSKGWGGKQPAMRSTTILQHFSAPTVGGKALCLGDVQSLVFEDGDEPPFDDPNAVDFVGQPKGLAQVAYERGLWRAGLVKYDDNNHERSLFHILGDCLDFQTHVQSILEEEITKRGHKCDFLPKFHCELNPIERIWVKI